MTPKTLRKALAIASVLTPVFLTTGCGNEIVLHPAGPVGRGELHLIYLSMILSLAVIIPVIVLMVFIVMRYRDKPGNRAKYLPNWADSRVLETVWWCIPIVIVGILGTATVKEARAVSLPPERNTTPITIEVTSLDWKWLFQYPDQKIATVNYCKIPTGRPVQFVLTSDAPMNSFWVPQLGGQEYSMPGMAMRLWLQADKSGDYYGHSANFSGSGFTDMEFHVYATSESDFDKWASNVKQTAPALTMVGYNKLTAPSVVSPATYSSYPANSFNDTVMKNGGQYMSSAMNMMKSINSNESTDSMAQSMGSMGSMNATNSTSSSNSDTSSMNMSGSNNSMDMSGSNNK